MRVTLKAKLSAAFAVILALSAAGMGVSISKLGRLNEAFDVALNSDAAAVQVAGVGNLGGFALNLNDGADPLDTDFKRQNS